jgi:hypothetical protein
MSEPLNRTPRMKITPTETPAPRWAGHVYFCEKCLAPNQLEAGDQCMAVVKAGWEYLTPRCPTRGCGHRSRIMLPASASALLKIGLEEDSAETADATAPADWNAS